MNLTDLESVVAVAQYGSISKAAKELFVAQPNLSKAVRDLEDEFGVVIFKRTVKGVIPTSDGQEFIQKAKGVLKQVDSLKGEFGETSAKKEKLKISVPRASYISHAFAKYVNELPAESIISLHYDECNSNEVINNILNLKYGLGVIRFDIEHEEDFLSFLHFKGLRHEILFEFEYQLLVSKNSPLVEKEHITETDLRDYIEIVHGDTKLPNGEYLNIVSGKENRGEKRIYVHERGSQFDLLTDAPNTYMWVSPIPGELLERYALIQKKSSCETKKMKDFLIFREGHRKSKSEKIFLDILNETKEEVKQNTN
ncbi:LysR family transcriptional regulator [Hespellia stercorisuis]|uniref:DNA-binding transcriptional regulator, LysR family n=1 Tax=Hespellia stercorisuis DSM 15480 TaxID=1121950 RepID=A0A1M6MLW8_9FIRM|nr:LysR family transcriptional regulator [Hespellia stercorisuis]SHJ84467.1 DNA-binding transcriptional regulator, LysR family [Hespellia stercorisuis DSM 15480]